MLIAALVALVCVRAWVPVTTYAHFDSDQAVFGIMASDLAAFRTFPMFMYGQRYLLAVSVWLCAPLFAAFGASIVTLKLPMFLMNLAVVAMLWIGLRRDGIGPWGAALAILPFAMPAVVPGTRLVEHQGGNIEPFVFVLAAFFLRRRPIALGALLGVAFLNREFSLNAFFALLLMDFVQGRLLERFRPHAVTTATFGMTVAALRTLAHWSEAYGGSTGLYRRPNVDNLVGFFGQQLATLIGGAPRTLLDFNIISSLTAGSSVVYVVLIAWLCVIAAVFAFRQPLERRELDGMSAFLVLVGIGQAAAYLLLSPYPLDKMVVRYVLLTLLALCGLAALAWRRPSLRLVTAGVILLMTVVNLTGTVRLLREYASGPPVRPLNVLADALVARRARYVSAGYWTAFDVSFVTGERVIASPSGGSRVDRYDALLAAHRDETFTVEDRPRAGCDTVLQFQICPPSSHPPAHADAK